MKTGLVALALAACLALVGCFTSEAPLFDARQGQPLLGKGRLLVTTFKDGEKPDTGKMEWTDHGYVEIGKAADGAMSFHPLPGTGWFSPWYIGQTNFGDGTPDGYMYLLYRKDGKKLFSYDVSCTDLTAQEAVAAHLVRTDSGQECKATRAADIAQAFRLLSKRKPAEGYMVAEPTK